jgi:hypothetical protein
LKEKIGFDFINIGHYEEAIKKYYSGKLDNLRKDFQKNYNDHTNSIDEIDLGLKLFLHIHEYQYNDWLLFSVDDIKRIDDSIVKEEFACFLKFFSITIGKENNSDFKYPNDNNLFREFPILAFGNRYLLINFQIIHWCVRERLEGIIKKNNKMWNKYNKHKSNYLESKSLDILSEMFPNANKYQELYYHIDEKRCELDGLIKYDNNIILIEAKSGVYAKSAKNGGEKRLLKVVHENIQKAAEQASRAKEYIVQTEKPVFKDKNGKNVLELKKNGFENIFQINITLDNFAELSLNLLQLKEIGYYKYSSFPWSISLSDVIVITDFIQFPNQFLHYIYFREKFSNKVFIGNRYKYMNELDLFGFYLNEETEQLTNYFIDDINENILAYNAYCKTEMPIEDLVPDFSSMYNVFYNGQNNDEVEYLKPSKQYNKKYYDMVRQLEKYCDQGLGYTNFAVKLLDLNNHKQDEIINLIESIIAETLKSKKISVKSTPYLSGNFDDKATFGITIIAGYLKDRDYLLKTLKAMCVKNRYQYKYQEWLGLCCFVDSPVHLVNFFVIAREEDKEDLDLAMKLKSLPKIKAKVGRNAPCPCGSGNKYKRCCGK